jgi:hypothetical protein
MTSQIKSSTIKCADLKKAESGMDIHSSDETTKRRTPYLDLMSYLRRIDIIRRLALIPLMIAK